MDRFIDKIKAGDARRDARRARDRPDPARPVPGPQRDQPAVAHRGARDHPFASSPVFRGGSAIGSPYFQSISLGFECAMYLAGLIAQPDLPLEDMLDRYELYIYKQWLRVYMRSKMIKHNKDLFEPSTNRRAAGKTAHLLTRNSDSSDRGRTRSQSSRATRSVSSTRAIRTTTARARAGRCSLIPVGSPRRASTTSR